MALAAAAGPKATPTPEWKAVEIARNVMQAMGGQDAWRRARFLRFDFSVKIRGQEMIYRSHLWDKQTGRYRLEDKDANGQAGVVLFNVASRQGTAYVAGKKLEGSAASAAVNAALHAFTNDIDWLAMPWRWLEPNVHLTYAGKKDWNGLSCDVLELTRDETGGPSQRYRAFISPVSHLMEHWEVLEGANASTWDWQYTTVSGIKLGSEHTNQAKQATISMGIVRALDKVDDAFLTDPRRPLAEIR